MTLEKLTSKNWFPITERVPVYAEHLNVVIDEINNMTDGGSEFDTISEKTAGAGVTVDGLKIIDKGIDMSTALTGEFDINLPDNVASALDIKVSTNSYIKFTTTNAGEKIVAGKQLQTINGTVADPAIVSTASNSGVFFASGIAGFSTAGSHYAELTGDGSFQVYTTSSTGGIKSISGEVCPLIPVAAQNEIAINGAIILTNFLTTIDSTSGALALTLANGSVVGQLKKIIFRVDNGDAVVTGNFTGTNTTLTFSDAGEYALLQWNGTEWIALELGSVLNMTHAPIISGLV